MPPSTTDLRRRLGPVLEPVLEPADAPVPAQLGPASLLLTGPLVVRDPEPLATARRLGVVDGSREPDALAPNCRCCGSARVFTPEAERLRQLIAERFDEFARASEGAR